MYNFMVQSYSTYKGLFYWLNWPGYISNVFLRPIVFMIMFSIMGRFASDPIVAQGYALGMALYSITYLLMGSIAQSYANERTLGTLSFLFVSSANRLVNFISRSVFHYPNALIAFASGLITAWVMVHLNFEPVNWSGFVIAVLVVVISVTAFGQLIGIFSIVFRDWVSINTLLSGVMLVLTGVIVPVTVFPAAVEEFARLLPMTNGLFAVKDAFIGASFSQISGDILRESLNALGCYIIGFLGFILFERFAKRQGYQE